MQVVSARICSRLFVCQNQQAKPSRLCRFQYPALPAALVAGAGDESGISAWAPDEKIRRGVGLIMERR